jgi:gliding motility-associated-like protein
MNLHLEENFRFTLQLNVPAPEAGDTGYWTVSGKNIKFDSPADTLNNTPTIHHLQLGENSLIWHLLTRRVCTVLPDTVFIIVKDLIRFNAFSPNGDGINDTFRVDSLEYVGPGVTAQIKIFNRLGLLVYSSDQWNNKWDGKGQNGEPVPQDTYYYVLTILFENEPERIYKGYVILKR